MGGVVNAVFAPGFFHSDPVRTALIAGAIVALVSGAVGVITVLRGQSFAGHALSALGTLGGSAAFLVGVSPLWGFLTSGVVVAGAMEAVGTQRRRGRDVATGLVLSTALGLSALLLYFDTIANSTTGVTITILFGSLFAISGITVPAMILLSLVCLAVLALLYRPLLLSSVSAELAAARGIPVRALGLAFLLLMALSAALSSVAVGTILSTALLIGPAATALRLTRRPAMAMAVAGAIGVISTWAGIVLAYDSYHWAPAGKGWPVSFFVVAVIFTLYLVADLGTRLQAARARDRRTGSPAAAQPLATVRSS
ncbi:metal ABC transporter permease [Streptomyces sp. RB6PN25]|uniref:Metal ABC transporter permease n=1 Tax=Streptomyces humicola TaxID=2953240 RepID=A0ABT1PNN2_9ACTN|nr:metal ABC transporter permease [Streptomyces humicola]MCQ4079273.1 metal ABC transporter permease [Streptomyces humicola]